MSLDQNGRIAMENSGKHLIFTQKGKYKWQDDLMACQQFLEEILGIKEEWSTPGGEAEQLNSDDLIMRWCGLNESIKIIGPKADQIRLQLEICASTHIRFCLKTQIF